VAYVKTSTGLSLQEYYFYSGTWIALLSADDRAVLDYIRPRTSWWTACKQVSNTLMGSPAKINPETRRGNRLTKTCNTVAAPLPLPPYRSTSALRGSSNLTRLLPTAGPNGEPRCSSCLLRPSEPPLWSIVSRTDEKRINCRVLIQTGRPRQPREHRRCPVPNGLARGLPHGHAELRSTKHMPCMPIFFHTDV
jgi:hypothetical protein